MGRIAFTMNMSLDGYITDAAGEISFPMPGPDLRAHYNDLMRNTALAICGRRLYEAMSYWDSPDDIIGSDPLSLEFAQLWRRTPKLVFSSTLTEVGPNARLVRGEVGPIVRPIKEDTDGDIIVEGPNLASQLVEAGLVDEFWIYVHPVVLGGGKPFFNLGTSRNLTLLGNDLLPQDVLLLRYAPKAG